MTAGNTIVKIEAVVHKMRARRYAGALLALGLSASVGGWGPSSMAWGEDSAQAVDPVNIHGRGVAPEVAVPTVVSPATPATVPAPVVTQSPPVPATQGPMNSDASDINKASPTLPPPLPLTPPPAPATTVETPPTPATIVEAPTTVPATESAATTTAATTTTAPTTLAAPEVPAGPAPSIPSSSAAAIAADGKSYPVTAIKINYFSQHAQQPSVAELLNMPVKFGVTKDGLIAPRAGVPVVTLRLGDVGRSSPQRIYRSAIEQCYVEVVRFFNAKGIIGVFVVVDSKDIDASDNDIRTDHSSLQFIIVTSTVKKVRTVATGDRVQEGDRINSSRHREILERSPLQAGSGREDLLNKDALDEYVLRLNRQPGRRVDVAVSGTGQLGGVNLDYLVSESRPWYVYAQASNTGTKQTNAWRERVGFVDNQLTGHNDIMTLDYSTAGFDASHAVIGSYEIPFFSFERLRYRIYGSWNEYTASDVGQSKEKFTGSEWTVGNEMIANIFQKRELFVDAIVGLRGQNVQTSGINGHGDATFISPYLTLRMDRITDIATTNASATLLGFLTDADKQKNLVPLGRNNVDQDSIVLQAEASQSLFLEPLLNPRGFVAGSSTLANELYVSVHGQYAFDYRLIPQDEDVAGGLYSVRGYPESLVAGDTVAVATAEYRLHIPRLFPIQTDPTKTPFLWEKSFRFSPQQAYGHPDWDLIARTFIDAGRVMNNKPVITDNDSTLVGTGVGLELQYKQNLNIRVDWGVALTDVNAGTTSLAKEGDSRVHISATVLY